MATMQNRYGAAFGLAVGLCMALAANITAAWPQGRVMIVVGVAAPIVLPLVLWIRVSLTPTAERFTLAWWCFVSIRETSIVAVAAPAASLSYWHTYTLMASHGVPHVIAAVLPLSADGVATISTLALHHHRPKPEPEVEPVVEPAAKPKVEPVVAPKPKPRTVADEVKSSHDRVAWLKAKLAANPDMTWSDKVSALTTEFGISNRTAARVIAKVS